ncbi:MAG: RNA polymerase sigma factor SigZ [Rubrobacteraceae bacterium]|nr:RNA polymerase sigma factor SigZ [Rubrobacter sp.]
MSVAVEEVYERFDSDLKKFIVRNVRDTDTAEDILQDVYLKIHTRIGTLEDEEKIRAWVYRIARNAITDHYRAKTPAAQLAEIPAGSSELAEEELEQQLSETVRGMLEGLPPDHRQALRLTEYEGLTQQELADRLGLSVSGAKSRVQRARTRLKTLLLDCCHFELDRRGRVVNYYDRDPDPH